MNNYPYFKYITGNSKIHLLNSKSKILCSLLILLNTILVRNYISMLLVSLFVLYIIFNTKINLKYYISNLMILLPVYLIVFLILFILSGNVLLSLLIVIKIIIIVLNFIIITFTTSLSEIAWGIECLFVKLKKFKVPVTKISLRIAFGIKFVSSLFDQIKQIRKSMAYRGVPYKGGVFKSIRKTFIPAIRLSLKLSKRTITAMKLRFYGYGKTRTNYHENKKTKFDTALLIINIILIYIVIGLGWIA